MRFSRPGTILERFLSRPLRPSDTYCSTLIGFIGIFATERRQVTQMRCFLQNARTIPLGVLSRLSVDFTVLREEIIILNLDEFHGRRAPFIVISDVIDPSGARIATHHPSVEGLQQFRGDVHIVHSGVEPQGRKSRGQG